MEEIKSWAELAKYVMELEAELAYYKAQEKYEKPGTGGKEAE